MFTERNSTRPEVALWSAWSDATKPEAGLLEHDAVASRDDRAEAFLRCLVIEIGAAGAVLALPPERGRERSLAVSGSADLSTAALRRFRRFSAAEATGATSDWAEADWIDCLLEGLAWQVLRLELRGPCGGSAHLALVFGKSASRSVAAARTAELQPMIDGFVALWLRDNAGGPSVGGLRAALNSVDIGLVMLDRMSRVLFENDAATALIDGGDYLRRNGDGLAALDLRDAMALQVALSHVIARPHREAGAIDNAPVLTLRSSNGDRPLLVSVIPAAGEAHDPAAILCISDPRLDMMKQLQPVCRLYGLSPVESRLVYQLATGGSLQQAAVAMRIKEQTARGYLKQVFLKTNTRRQADLVRSMLSSLLRTRRGLEPIFLF